MILVIFSFAGSAVMLSLSAALFTAGITVTCLYTPDTFNLVIRIIGLCVAFVCMYALSGVKAFKSVQNLTDKTGYRACDTDTLSAKLYKLSRRAYFGKMRGAILIEYAYALLCMGKYKDAEIAASDAIVAAGDGIKGDAAVIFCKIYFMIGDKKYFDVNYVKAADALGKCVLSKNPAVRNTANASKAAIEAMRLSLCGDYKKAISRLDDFNADAVAPLIQNNLAELKKYIENLKTAET